MKYPLSFLIPVILLTPNACAQNQDKQTAADRPPDFITIFADDQGYGDLGCFGATHVQTPNIDKLAQEGLKLTSSVVNKFCVRILISPDRMKL